MIRAPIPAVRTALLGALLLVVWYGRTAGAIDDDAWTHGTTELVRGGIVRAAVSRLAAEGTSFSVVWKHR